MKKQSFYFFVISIFFIANLGHSQPRNKKNTLPDKSIINAISNKNDCSLVRTFGNKKPSDMHYLVSEHQLMKGAFWCRINKKKQRPFFRIIVVDPNKILWKGCPEFINSRNDPDILLVDFQSELLKTYPNLNLSWFHSLETGEVASKDYRPAPGPFIISGDPRVLAEVFICDEGKWFGMLFH